jgi:hypothetical protein
MKEPTRSRFERFITIFLFATLVGSIVFTVVRMLNTPSEISGGEDVKAKSDYALMLLQCTLGLVVMALPSFIEKRLDLRIPSIMMIFYLLFLYAAIYLGEVRSFYYIIPHWDVILHCFSGFMLGCLGFSFITLLNKWEKIPIHLSPLFVAIFAFCFTLSLGVFWEIYEFGFDGLLNLNMQKFIEADGTAMIGREALKDTMEDLIVDGIGAFAASLVGYISLKYNKGWIEKFQIKRKHST